MGWGNFVTYTNSIAVGATATPAYDLGRQWEKVYLGVPTMSAYCVTGTCNFTVQGGDGVSGTFFTVIHPMNNSTTSGVVTFVIANSASAQLVPIPNGFRFIKIVASNTMTAAVNLEVFCAD